MHTAARRNPAAPLVACGAAAAARWRSAAGPTSLRQENPTQIPCTCIAKPTATAIRRHMTVNHPNGTADHLHRKVVFDVAGVRAAHDTVIMTAAKGHQNAISRGSSSSNSVASGSSRSSNVAVASNTPVVENVSRLRVVTQAAAHVIVAASDGTKAAASGPVVRIDSCGAIPVTLEMNTREEGKDEITPHIVAAAPDNSGASSSQITCPRASKIVSAQRSGSVATTVQTCQAGAADPVSAHQQLLWERFAALAEEILPERKSLRVGCPLYEQRQQQQDQRLNKKCISVQRFSQQRGREQQKAHTVTTQPFFLYRKKRPQQQENLSHKQAQQHGKYLPQSPHLQQPQRAPLVLFTGTKYEDAASVELQRQQHSERPSAFQRRQPCVFPSEAPPDDASIAEAAASAAEAAAVAAAAAAAKAPNNVREVSHDADGACHAATAAAGVALVSEQPLEVGAAAADLCPEIWQESCNFLQAFPAVGTRSRRQHRKDGAQTADAPPTQTQHQQAAGERHPPQRTQPEQQRLELPQSMQQWTSTHMQELVKQQHEEQQPGQQQQPEEQQAQEQQRMRRRRLRQQQQQGEHHKQQQHAASIMRWRGTEGSLSKQITTQLKKQQHLLSLLVETLPDHRDRSAQQQHLIEMLQQHCKRAVAHEKQTERIKTKQTQPLLMRGRLLALPYPALLRGLAACSQLKTALLDINSQHTVARHSNNTEVPDSNSNNGNSHYCSSTNGGTKKNEFVAQIAREAILDVFYHLTRFPTAHIVRLLRLLAFLPRYQLLQPPTYQSQQHEKDSLWEQSCYLKEPQQYRYQHLQQKSVKATQHSQRLRVEECGQQQQQKQQQQQQPDQCQQLQVQLFEQQVLLQQQEQQQQNQGQATIPHPKQTQRLQHEEEEDGQLQGYAVSKQQAPPYTSILRQQNQSECLGDRGKRDQVDTEGNRNRRQVLQTGNSSLFPWAFSQDPLQLRGELLLLLRLRLLIFLTRHITPRWLRCFSVEDLAGFVDACAYIVVRSRDLSNVGSHYSTTTPESHLEHSTYYGIRNISNTSGGDVSHKSCNVPDSDTGTTTINTTSQGVQLQQKVEQILNQLQQQMLPLLHRIRQELPRKIGDASLQHLAMLARGFGRLGTYPDLTLFQLIKQRLLSILADAQQPCHRQQLQHAAEQIQERGQKQHQHHCRMPSDKPLPIHQIDQQQTHSSMQRQEHDGHGRSTDGTMMEATATRSSLCFTPECSSRDSSDLRDECRGSSTSNGGNDSSSNSSQNALSSHKDNSNFQEGNNSKNVLCSKRILLGHSSRAQIAAELNALACICGEAVRHRDFCNNIFANAVVDRLVTLLAQQQQQQASPEEQQWQSSRRHQNMRESHMATECWKEDEQHLSPLRRTDMQEVAKGMQPERIRGSGIQQDELLWSGEQQQLQYRQIHGCDNNDKDTQQPLVEEARYTPKLCLWLLSQHSAVQQLRKQPESLLSDRSTYNLLYQQQQQEKGVPELDDRLMIHQQQGEEVHQQKLYTRDLTLTGSCSWLSEEKRFYLATLLQAPATAALPRLQEVHALVPVLHFSLVFSGTKDVRIETSSHGLIVNKKAGTVASAFVTGSAGLANKVLSEGTPGISPNLLPPATCFDRAPTKLLASDATALPAATPEALLQQLLLQRAYMRRLLLLITRTPLELPRGAASICVAMQSKGVPAGRVVHEEERTILPATSCVRSNSYVAADCHDRTAAVAAARGNSGVATPLVSPHTAAAAGLGGTSSYGHIPAPAVRSLSFLLQHATEAHARICVTYLKTLGGSNAVERRLEVAKPPLKQQRLTSQHCVRLNDQPAREQVPSCRNPSTRAVTEVSSVEDAGAATAVEKRAAPASDPPGTGTYGTRHKSSGTVATATCLPAAENSDHASAASTYDPARAESIIPSSVKIGAGTAPAARYVLRAADAFGADSGCGEVMGAAEADAAETDTVASIETVFHCVLLELLVLQRMQELVPQRPENAQYLYPCMLRAAAALSSIFALPCGPAVLCDVLRAKGSVIGTSDTAAEGLSGEQEAAGTLSFVAAFSADPPDAAARPHRGVSVCPTRPLAASASEDTTAVGEIQNSTAADSVVGNAAVGGGDILKSCFPVGCGAVAATSDRAAAGAIKVCVTAAGSAAANSFPYGTCRRDEGPAAADVHGASLAAAAQQGPCERELPGAAARTLNADDVFSVAATAGYLLSKAVHRDKVLADLLVQQGIGLPPVSSHRQLLLQHHGQHRQPLQHRGTEQKEHPEQGPEHRQQREVDSQLLVPNHCERTVARTDISGGPTDIRFLHALQQKLLLPILSHLCCPRRLEQYRRAVRSSLQRGALRPVVAELWTNCRKIFSSSVSRINRSSYNSGVDNRGSESATSRRQPSANGSPRYNEPSPRTSGAEHTGNYHEAGDTGGGSRNLVLQAPDENADTQNSEREMSPTSRLNSHGIHRTNDGPTTLEQVGGRGIDGDIMWQQQQQLDRLHSGLLRLSESFI